MADERPSFKRLNFAGVVPGSLLQILVLDIACPYMVYQFLLSRLSWLPSLLLVALFPLAGIVIMAKRQRILDLLGVAALYAIVCILVNMLLINSSTALGVTIPIAIAGLTVLATRWFSHPLLFYVDHYYYMISHPDQSSLPHQYWHEQPEYRKTMTHINQVCGWSQFIAALILSGPGYLLPQFRDMYLFLLPFIVFIFYLLLGIWAIHYKTSHEHKWVQTDSQTHQL